MALAWSAALEDRVALVLFGRPYSALTADQKTMMDGTTATSPTTGVVVDALTIIRQTAQWYELAGSATTTDAATAWLVCEVAFRMATNVRPERIEALRVDREEARQTYIDTVTASEITTGLTAGVFVLTYQNIRYHVLRNIVRRKVKGMSWPTPEEIDAETFWCLKWMWYGKKWMFRRRQVTITVPTATNGESPTINLVSGETFAGFASRRLYFSQAPADWVRWASADEYALLRSDTTVTTGKMRFVRVQRSFNTYKFLWHPRPDQEYTLYTEALIHLPGTTTPGVPDTVTDTVPFSKLPQELWAPFRQLVLGRVMKNRGLGEDVWNEAVGEIEKFAPEYDDQNEMDADGPTPDVYGDAFDQPATAWGIAGRGNAGWGGAM